MTKRLEVHKCQITLQIIHLVPAGVTDTLLVIQ